MLLVWLLPEYLHWYISPYRRSRTWRAKSRRDRFADGWVRIVLFVLFRDASISIFRYFYFLFFQNPLSTPYYPSNHFLYTSIVCHLRNSTLYFFFPFPNDLATLLIFNFIHTLVPFAHSLVYKLLLFPHTICLIAVCHAHVWYTLTNPLFYI